MANEIRDHAPWIDGQVVQHPELSRMIRYSPGDGREIATVALGTAAELDLATTAARRALKIWSQTPGSERGMALVRLADLMQANHEMLSRMEAEESGKPITAAREEVKYAAELTRYAASLAWNISGDLMADGGPDNLGMVMRQPRGVVGLILPWNYPLVTLMQKLPYALAAGCSAVIKPSEMTSGTTLAVASMAQEAGIPDGIVNVVTGTGEIVGEAISSHPAIDMISFTGSTKIGRQIASHSAKKLAHVALELGGKGANIVFADANLEASVEGVVQGFTINKGEECCAGSRILVEETIAEDFLDRLKARVTEIRLGLPLDEATEMGPIIHPDHMEKVLHYIETGKTEGAKVAIGGYRVTEGDFGKGCFVAPTIFTEATPDMTIFREEIFGPVASLSTFKTMAQAIEVANDTSYGLANGVWTSSLDRAIAVFRGLDSGMVYVNTFLETIPQLPFGGMKKSGLGRENGIEGLEEYLETKSAFIRLAT